MIIEKTAPRSAETAARFLSDGKLVIIPTDTIYGFSAIAPSGAARIFKAKGRDEGKPFIQLIARPEDISLYAETRKFTRLLSLWPGPVTVIVNVNSGGTVAFRCPGDAWLRKVIELTGSPIFSTSVNRAGESALGAIDEIVSEFGDVADLIVGSGDLVSGKASTIVDASGPALRIIRQGEAVIPPEYLCLS